MEYYKQVEDEQIHAKTTHDDHYTQYTYGIVRRKRGTRDIIMHNEIPLEERVKASRNGTK